MTANGTYHPVPEPRTRTNRQCLLCSVFTHLGSNSVVCFALLVFQAHAILNNHMNTEPVFRQAEKEWKDFVEEFTTDLVEADPQIPVLPPNDVVHRIYRDVRPYLYLTTTSRSLRFLQVRFSNDKTPYKTGFSASFSRSGRKGIFAGCELQIISCKLKYPDPKFRSRVSLLCSLFSYQKFSLSISCSCSAFNAWNCDYIADRY